MNGGWHAHAFGELYVWNLYRERASGACVCYSAWNAARAWCDPEWMSSLGPQRHPQRGKHTMEAPASTESVSFYAFIYGFCAKGCAGRRADGEQRNGNALHVPCSDATPSPPAHPTAPQGIYIYVLSICVSTCGLWTRPVLEIENYGLSRDVRASARSRVGGQGGIEAGKQTGVPCVYTAGSGFYLRCGN